MEKSVEIKAATVEIAVEKALEELQTTKDKVDVEIVSKGGLFQKAQVRVTVKEDASENLEEFINGILQRMGLVSRAKVEEKEGVLNIEISGEDSGVAIGYRGEALDAFQYLALTFLNQEKSEFKKVVVNCENYREKRQETLTALALRLAEKAVRIQRKIALEPMNPFERRIIHSALAESGIAETASEGEEPNRFVVIIPKGVELKDERPVKNGGEDDRHRSRQGGGRDGGRRDGRDNRNSRYGNGGGRDDRRDERRGDRYERRDRAPREDEPEVEDGKVYRGYYTEPDEFTKPTEKAGPPKFKSFGGKKRF